jgi:hypothetical protein
MDHTDTNSEIQSANPGALLSAEYRLQPDDLRRLMSSFPAWQRLGEYWIMILGSAPGLILILLLGYQFAFVASFFFTLMLLGRAFTNRVDVAEDIDFGHVENTRISIYDEFLEHASSIETSMRRWDGFRRVVFLGDDILLHVKKFVRMLIPARAFASPQERQVFFEELQTKIIAPESKTELVELPRIVLDRSLVSLAYEQTGWAVVQGQNKLAQTTKNKKLGAFWAMMLTLVPFLVAFGYILILNDLSRLGGNNFLFEMIAFLCFMGITAFSTLAAGKFFMWLVGDPSTFEKVQVAVEVGSKGIEVRTRQNSTFCPWQALRPIKILPIDQLALINKLGFVLAVVPPTAFVDQKHKNEFLRQVHAHRTVSLEKPIGVNRPATEETGNPFQPPRDLTGL